MMSKSQSFGISLRFKKVYSHYSLSECARVTLPHPLSTKHEALIEVRRGTNEAIYNKYREESCNKKGM